MLHSLRIRLLITLILAVLVALGTVATLTSRSTSTEFQRYVESDIEDYTKYITPLIIRNLQFFLESQPENIADLPIQTEESSRRLSEDDLASNELSLQTVAEQMALVSSTRILVTNIEGIIIADSHDELVGEQRSPNLSDPVGVIIVRGETSLIYIEMLLGQSEQRFLEAVNRSVVTAVVTAGAVALLLTMMLSRRILNPIGDLTDAARDMEIGDLSRRVAITTRDEIGELGHAFNAMAEGLQTQEQLRRNMVTDVAHELRTPLSNIRGYLEAIQDGVAQPSEEIVTSIYEEAMLLNRLIDDLQELALAEAGKLTMAFQIIPLETIVLQAVNGVRPMAVDKTINVEVSAMDERPSVKVDPKRIGQVFRNLLNNAIHYTGEGGTIDISALLIDGFIEVRIHDTGVGIESEDLPFIFERFYRADKSRARTTGGAGLGLAIVRQLVNAHDGEIRVTSRVGQGSTFSFTLPCT